MSASIHKELLSLAKTDYPEIHALITHNGVVELEAKTSDEFFPYMAKTVVSQLLSVAAAGTIWKRVIELAEQQNKGLKDIFSTEHEQAVRDCGLSNSKFKAISGLKVLLDNDADFAETVLASNYQQVRKLITSLWGFGEWSADICAIFYCALPDVYAPKDVAVVNGIKKLCKDTKSPEQIADDFSPYKSYFCRHIWLGTNNGYIDSIKGTK